MVADMAHIRFPSAVPVFMTAYSEARQLVSVGTIFDKPVDFTQITETLHASL
jgi:hypothetical protein